MFKNPNPNPNHDYSWQARQDASTALFNTTGLRKAALAAGESTYAVPLCGGGFTDHRRSSLTGKCVDCKQVRRETRAAAAALLKPVIRAVGGTPETK